MFRVIFLEYRIWTDYICLLQNEILFNNHLLNTMKKRKAFWVIIFCGQMSRGQILSSSWCCAVLWKLKKKNIFSLCTAKCWVCHLKFRLEPLFQTPHSTIKILTVSKGHFFILPMGFLLTLRIIFFAFPFVLSFIL